MLKIAHSLSSDRRAGEGEVKRETIVFLQILDIQFDDVFIVLCRDGDGTVGD